MKSDHTAIFRTNQHITHDCYYRKSRDAIIQIFKYKGANDMEKYTF